MSKMSRETSLAKNTLIMTIGTVLPKISHLITLPIITAALTKAEYGIYDLIITLVSLFLPIATLQVQTAAFRFLIDCKDDKKGIQTIVTNVMMFVLISSLFSLSILYVLLFQLTTTIKILICLYFFTDILFLTFVQIVRGLSNPKLYAICTSVQPVINMLLVIVFVYFMDGRLIGALIAMTGSTTVALCIVLLKGKIISKINLKRLSKQKLKEIVSYSWPMIPNSLSLWFLHFSDRLVLLNFMGLDATAIYGVANKIPSMYSLANSAFTLAWQENASINQKDDDVKEYYGKVFDHVLRILSGIMALLIAATPLLFILLIQGDYEKAYYHMPILLMSMFFSSISSFLGGIYIAHKKTKSVGATTIVAAIINLIVNLLLIKEIGIFAASISTLVSYVFLAVYRMNNVLKFQKIQYRYKNLLYYISVLVLMSLIAFYRTIYFNILNVMIAVIFALLINRDLVKKTMHICTKWLKKE